MLQARGSINRPKSSASTRAASARTASARATSAREKSAKKSPGKVTNVNSPLYFSELIKRAKLLHLFWFLLPNPFVCDKKH